MILSIVFVRHFSFSRVLTLQHLGMKVKCFIHLIDLNSDTCTREDLKPESYQERLRLIDDKKEAYPQ